MPVKHRKTKPAQNSGIIFIIKKVLIASVIGAAVFFILSAAAAFIVYKKDAEPSCFNVIVPVLSGISGIICGIAAILPVKRNGLIIGMASAMPAFFIVIAVSLIINRAPVSNIGWASMGTMILCGGIGGILGNKK